MPLIPEFRYQQESDFSKRLVKADPLLLSSESFYKFHPDTLGIGFIGGSSVGPQSYRVIAAVFDLEGFTVFCDRRDPEHAVPKFLTTFLNHLFSDIAQFSKKDEDETADDVILRTRLPFFTKFLGDGVLFLWDTAPLDHGQRTEVFNVCFKTARGYGNILYPLLLKTFSEAPKRLRCGIACGSVYAIGEGNQVDFVGPCINIASKIQKLHGLSFAALREGLDFYSAKGFGPTGLKIQNTNVPGVGREQLVVIDAIELSRLKPKDRKHFREP